MVGMVRLWRAVVCGGLQLVSVSTGSAPSPPAWAAPIGVVAAAVAAASSTVLERAPLVVLGVATAAHVLQVATLGPAFPVVTTVAAFVVARDLLVPARRLAAPTAALLGSLAAVSVSAVVVGDPSLALPTVLLLVLGLVGGLLVALRRAHAEADRRELLSAERLRIARDLHDSVGHGIGAITVQAGAGRMAVAAGADEEATRALQAIEEAARSVLREVRWTVAQLRDGSGRRHLGEVSELVLSARRSGLDVDFRPDGDLDSAEPDVAEVAYRVVQEALTNVVRHSDARSVQVSVVVWDDVELTIHDAGSPSPPSAEAGSGLGGMHERVGALGGSVRAGPDPAGGWSVTARLPRKGRP
jgi:signal transduction histidine kinase